MDNQAQPIQQAPAIIPQDVAPPPPNKSNSPSITWIIIALLVIASLVTAAAYFFLARPSTTPIPEITQTEPTAPPLREKAKWQMYTNEKYQYSFAYPVTWTITKQSADQKSFELHDQTSADQAVITVQYLTSEELSKLSILCEETDDQFRCHRYSLTEKSEILVDRFTPTNDTKVDSFVTLPTNGTLRIQITDPNADSYDTFAIMVDTLKFPNEKRIYGLQICPDIWPAAGQTVPYNGVTFAASDIDATWVNENCKY